MRVDRPAKAKAVALLPHSIPDDYSRNDPYSKIDSVDDCAIRHHLHFFQSKIQNPKSKILRTVSAAVCALCVMSCSDSVSTPAAVPIAQPHVPAAPPRDVPVRVHVVDMDGAPVANMAPIATERANAFDTPVAKGELTGADGSSSLRVPGDQYLYVRAWDPAKRMFANNYYDVLPGNAPPGDVLSITMLPGAQFDVEILGADGAPVASQPVGMMMSHPVHGPWWPAETTTDEQGRARFASVPPGKYAITIETRDHRHVDLPEQTLLPGKSTDAGPVTLR
ncbi:MAG: carboxypeptidase regulatory-like domain-containing protein [Candidatus Hydrogenedentes bacterium]|nr:carboxypeptidase regulatory-like domain-containing protein [Candidatus Hydrogenedentota bacterium]